jgi:hypothetical protein
MLQPKIHISVLLLVIQGIGSMGCLGGVASVQLKGRITAGDKGHFSFDENISPSTLQPVANANLVFYAVKPETLCAEAAKRLPQPQSSITTDSEGKYEIERYYTGVVGGSHVKLLLCVSHPDFKPFYYETIVGKSTEPRHGEKFLNIQLEKK